MPRLLGLPGTSNSQEPLKRTLNKLVWSNHLCIVPCLPGKNDLAQDRSDIQVAMKELSRGISCSTVGRSQVNIFDGGFDSEAMRGGTL